MASRRILPILIGIALAGPAWAKSAPPPHKTRRYVLREVHIEGNASDAEKKLLNERIWSALELISSEARDELTHAEDVTAALAEHPDLKNCYDARCGVGLGDVLKADKVLSISVGRSGAPDKGDWVVRIWHVDVRAFKVGQSVELPCHACSAEDLMGDLSHSVGPALEVIEGQMCTVKVTSRPEGATVSLDGVRAGVTPFVHSILPGKHAVAVDQSGFSRGEDELDCPSGSMQNMSFALTAGGGAVVHQEGPQLVRRSPALKIIGATLVVLGVGGVAGGAADLYLDGRGTCNLAAGQTQCPNVYDTKVAGGALVGVGVAALVTGAVLLIVDAVRGPTVASHAKASSRSLAGSFLQGEF